MLDQERASSLVDELADRVWADFLAGARQLVELVARDLAVDAANEVAGSQAEFQMLVAGVEARLLLRLARGEGHLSE